MKRTGVVIASLCLCILLATGLAGCKRSDSVMKAVNIKTVSNDVTTYIGNTQKANGFYLYYGAKGKPYFIASYSSVLQGEEAKYLKSIEARVENRELIIRAQEQGTLNYQDQRLGRVSVFQLPSSKSYDTIHIYKNGKETSFINIGG